MIKDIGIIRKELEGFVEIELPYDFEKGCHIKYITLKNNEDSFYKGGKFNYYGNDCIYLKTNSKNWCVPICKRNKDGIIQYKSRFFIKENCENNSECLEKNNELSKTIEYQQLIIEKLKNNLKDLELLKYSLIKEKREYEELLQQNRYNLKEISIDNREKDKKIKEYEKIIKKLTNSHSVFN